MGCRGEYDGFVYLGEGTFKVCHKGMTIVRLDIVVVVTRTSLKSLVRSQKDIYRKTEKDDWKTEKEDWKIRQDTIQS